MIESFYRKGQLAIMETIGQRIRRLREERDLLQEDFAPKCGIGQSTLSGIELHNKKFTAQTLYAFARELEVSNDEIMFGTQGEIVGQSELVRLFAELSPEQRNTILDMARVMQSRNKPNSAAA